MGWRQALLRARERGLAVWADLGDAAAAPWPLALPLAGFSSPRLAGGLHRLLQQRHDVDHVAAALALVLHRGLVQHLGLAALHFLADERHQVLAVAVVIAVWLPLAGHPLDQHLRHLHLAVVHPQRVQVVAGEIEVTGAAQLVRVAQDLEHQHLVLGNHGGQVLARADHHLGDAHLAGALQGLAQQGVRLAALLVERRKVVGLVEELGVDLVEVDEVGDVDRLRLLGVRALEVLVADQHVAVVLVLVALHDVLELDILAGLLVVLLVADRREVLLVELPEADLIRRLGGEEADGDVHEAEADAAFPDRAGHAGLLERLPKRLLGTPRVQPARQLRIIVGWRRRPHKVFPVSRRTAPDLPAAIP
jgi:hypothetical protein